MRAGGSEEIQKPLLGRKRQLTYPSNPMMDLPGIGWERYSCRVMTEYVSMAVGQFKTTDACNQCAHTSTHRLLQSGSAHLLVVVLLESH